MKPDAVREALEKIERAYRDWDPDATFASTALAVVSKIAADALAALDSRAGDAGEAIGYQVRIAYGEWHPALCSEAEAARMVANVDSAVCEMRPVYAATPAPTVDALTNLENAMRAKNMSWDFHEGYQQAIDDVRKAMAAPAVDAVPAGEVELLKEAARAHRQCATIANLFANAADNQGRYLLKADALEAVREVAHRIGCAAGQIDLKIAALSHGEGRK